MIEILSPSYDFTKGEKHVIYLRLPLNKIKKKKQRRVSGLVGVFIKEQKIKRKQTCWSPDEKVNENVNLWRRPIIVVGD